MEDSTGKGGHISSWWLVYAPTHMACDRLSSRHSIIEGNAVLALAALYQRSRECGYNARKLCWPLRTFPRKCANTHACQHKKHTHTHSTHGTCSTTSHVVDTPKTTSFCQTQAPQSARTANNEIRTKGQQDSPSARRTTIHRQSRMP